MVTGAIADLVMLGEPGGRPIVDRKGILLLLYGLVQALSPRTAGAGAFIARDESVGKYLTGLVVRLRGFAG